VRFLRLAAGSIIREHRDYDLGYDEGQVRLHIPIITNPAVDFFLDAQRIEMKEGECWYLDLSLPHWVENRGLTDRVHLVIDCEVNEWIRELLASESHNPGMPIAPPANEEFASAPGELQRFRQIVLTDLNLQRRLRETADRESFTRLVVSIGQQGGYLFTAADVENAIEAARKTWLERWVE
jgi:aspartyl/asparaginyl beta-hydroxylase (cupin superfamily)